MSGTTRPGWYPDPLGRAPDRWWDGVWWTPWETDGSRQWLGTPPAPARRPHAYDLPALSFVRTTFLPEARRRGTLDESHVEALARLADELALEVGGPHGVPTVVPAPPDPHRPAPQTEALPTEHPPAPSRPTHAPAAPYAPAPPDAPPAGHAPPPPVTAPVPLAPVRAPRAPGRLARWWASSKLRLDTDLTVHGLTYLGVLLLFVGVFGLVAFAFGDVEPGLRPVAELAVAAVPFVAATLLARSGARFVARAMIAVGALILPVMVVTSTVDGFHVPPDLRGAALPLGTGLTCAALATAYALRVRRRPGSAFAVMVAPVAWFAAGMGAVALGRPVPHGEDVAVPGAAQVAVIAVAVLVTTWLARRTMDRGPAGATAPSPGLAAGALAAAPAGIVVTAVLALLAGVSEGFPLVPVIVTTAALAMCVQRLLPNRGDAVLAVAWFAVVARVVSIGETTPVLSEHLFLPGAALGARPVLLLASVLVAAALLELMARRAAPSAPAFAVVAWVVPVVAIVGVLLPDGAWWGITGALALTAWAPVRRVTPPLVPGAGVALDAIAAAAPVAVVVGVWLHVSGPAAGVLTALLALAVTPLARGRLHRGRSDRLWVVWWACAVVVAVLAAGVLGAGGLLTSAAAAERAVVPGMLALVVVALVVGPAAPGRAVALATPVAWSLCAAVVEALGWDSGMLPLGYATLGLGVVAAAHLGRPTRQGHVPAARRFALAVAGHVTVAVAAWTVSDARTLAIVLAASTLGWLVTAVLGDLGRSPVGAALDRAGAMRSLPWALTLVGLPTTAVVALHAGDLVRVDDPSWAMPFVVAALASAAATRLRTPERLRPVLPWAAFVLAGWATLATAGRTGHALVDGHGSWPTAVALAALVLVAPLVRGRHAVLVWTAWLVLTPLVAVTAWTALGGVRDLGGAVVVVGALVAVGGSLAVGALLADRADPRQPRVLPQLTAAVPPFLAGGGQLALGILGAATLGYLAPPSMSPAGPVAAGVLLLAAAALAATVAGLSGIGGVAAVAALVTWVGVRRLLPDGAGVWVDVGAAALLLVVALAASLVRTPAARWARWDVPLSTSAAVPALVALLVAETGERSPVFVVVGGLAIGAGVRLARRRASSETLTTVGSVLVLLGAAWAGRAWAVGVLAGLAAAHTTLAALRESGAWRTARQWLGAVLAAAAWLAFVAGPTAFGGSDQARLDATALGAATVTLGAVAASVLGRWDRSWSAPWGGVGALLAGAAGLAPLTLPGLSWDAPRLHASGWQVAAWALLAVAAVLAGQLEGRRTDAEARAWRTAWRVTAVAPVIAALLAGLAAASAPVTTVVTALTAVSLVTAVIVVVAARTARRGLEVPLVVLGMATLVLAAGHALTLVGSSGAGLLGVAPITVVVAVSAVQAGAYGVALRVLGLRLAAPVLAWLAWVGYAADGLGGTVAWFTVPMGLAVIAVVELWRADRRRRGLTATEPGVAALDLAGVAFLVVASFVAAFTESVGHALVAAGVGVLVFFWAVLTRVRRRLLAGAVIVLAGAVVAAVLPLVALVPAWGGAALWVAVAVVGLLVVLAATFLERGRAAVVGGRERLRAATQDWE